VIGCLAAELRRPGEHIGKLLRPAGNHKPGKKPGQAPINEKNPSQETGETGR
jgi:hypothetical protein